MYKIYLKYSTQVNVQNEQLMGDSITLNLDIPVPDWHFAMKKNSLDYLGDLLF